MTRGRKPVVITLSALRGEESVIEPKPRKPCAAMNTARGLKTRNTLLKKCYKLKSYSPNGLKDFITL